MASAKGLFIAGIILGVVGIAAFIIALAALPPALKNIKNEQLEKAVVVSSEDSDRYDSWAGESSVENTYTQYYYAYNLTNLNDVVNKSAIPVYEQIGPFNYRYYWDYLNVSFGDDGNTATFSQRKWYVFDNDTSVSDEDTLITNINPTFLALADLTKQGLQFIVGSSGPQLAYFVQNNFSTPLVFTLSTGTYSPMVFAGRRQALLAALAPNETDPAAFYANAWANYTSLTPDLNVQLWSGMLPFYGLPLPQGSGISQESYAKIFDPSTPLSLLNTNQPSVLMTYMAAMGGDQNANDTIATAFGIDPQLLSPIFNWWFNFTNPAAIAQSTFGYVLGKCGLNPTDQNQQKLLGVCQALTGIPLQNTSLSTFSSIPALSGFTFGIPEIELSVGVTNISTLEFYQFLTNSGTGSLASLNGVGMLSAYAQYGNTPASPNVWGPNMTQDVAKKFIDYFGELGQSYSYFTLQSLLPQYGLFTTKTVREWLWTCSGALNDPLLMYLNLPIGCALQSNYTTYPPTTVYTGKNGFEWTNWLINWRNQTTIPWASPIPVEGYTESGQFAPDSKPDELLVFEENIYRPVKLDYSEDIDVQGISCRRYYLRNDSFPANATFYSDIDGLSNITSFNDGVPTFVSLWDMWEVSSNITSQTIGQNTTYENAAVPLDLEPTSGNALYYNLKLQLNFQIPPSFTTWDSTSGFYPQINSSTFLPSWKIGQTGNPSDDTIDTLKDALKKLKILKIAPVVIMAVIGGLMGIAGVFMAVKFGLKLKKY